MTIFRAISFQGLDYSFDVFSRIQHSGLDCRRWDIGKKRIDLRRQHVWTDALDGVHPTSVLRRDGSNS